MAQGCWECGAELGLSSARCPLCGADTTVEPVPRAVSEVEAYQGVVRSLREQLRAIRDEAEAV